MGTDTMRWAPPFLSFISGGTLAVCLLQIYGKQTTGKQSPSAVPLPQDYACDPSSLHSNGMSTLPEHAVHRPVPISWLDGLIVVARTDEDTSWLDRHLGDIPHVIYQIDAPEKLAGARHRVQQARGGSAAAYIQFIIDYYDNLPKSVVFLSGRRNPWFMTDHVAVIKRLRWGTMNYTSLRYSPGLRMDWLCGNRTQEWPYRDLNCNWVGLRLRPRGVPPRRENSVTVKNREEWERSIDLHSVCTTHDLLYLACLCRTYQVSV
eukprot:jgi/Botrbrau1/17478/Bobra.0054s0065.3